ncbi:MAG: rod shape-determining protein MreC [Candidatus Sericytochromatia bacterium]|nr:rod shape-determining protein MreC [Candidatus Tanganyikabacteria bacterium]
MPAAATARWPIRDVGFALAILALAGVTSWSSGRSMLLPELLSPGLRLVQAGYSAVRGGAGYLQDLDRLTRENHALGIKVNDLQRELTRRAEIESEVVRLRQLVGLASAIPEKGRFARIIGRSPDNWHARVYVDRGRRDGVAEGAVVMAPQGVVGKVMHAGERVAQVGLLTDPDNEVSCLNQRSRSPGVVAGEGEATLVMKYLQQQVDFRVGDMLVTSGMGGVYPKGLPLGRVARVLRHPNAITPQVTVVPEADLDRLEEVLILDPLPGVLK